MLKHENSLPFLVTRYIALKINQVYTLHCFLRHIKEQTQYGNQYRTSAYAHTAYYSGQQSCYK